MEIALRLEKEEGVKIENIRTALNSDAPPYSGYYSHGFYGAGGGPSQSEVRVVERSGNHGWWQCA